MAEKTDSDATPGWYEINWSKDLKYHSLRENRAITNRHVCHIDGNCVDHT